MAQLVSAIDAHDPAVIATNILFPVQDRSSPQKLPPPFSPAAAAPQADIQPTTQVDHDLVFAGRLASAPLVLGYEFLFDQPTNRDHQACPPCHSHSSYPRNNNNLGSAAPGKGHSVQLSTIARGRSRRRISQRWRRRRRRPLLMRYEQQISHPWPWPRFSTCSAPPACQCPSIVSAGWFSILARPVSSPTIAVSFGFHLFTEAL